MLKITDKCELPVFLTLSYCDENESAVAICVYSSVVADNRARTQESGCVGQFHSFKVRAC